MIKGFKAFLLKNNVLALAIAVIVGGAVGKVVSSLATDIIMPLVSFVLPSGEWRSEKWILSSHLGPDGKPNSLNYGTFLGNTVDFLIISLIVYTMTKVLLHESAPPPMKVCPRCKENVVAEAIRCKFCTSDL